VASDADQKITKAYDAVLAAKPRYRPERRIHRIRPHRKISTSTNTPPDPDKHVQHDCAFQKWQAEQKKGANASRHAQSCVTKSWIAADG